ncbi:unnamed protein product [Strongylus vulgaris]|uniref:Large ribosomal subunit protein uL23 N-terminal domain-containing protein n=1 Tax=Strongylus vulgaris TaxID=40348 RepID=A0A3P7J4J5_STRVU|nr:unnamed protein product [Strongylus vulgaris]
MAPPKTVKKGKVSKALDAKKKVAKGQHTVHKKKIRTSVHFRRPKTLKTPRIPRYPRKSAPARCKFDAFAVIKHPLTTESAMKKIEDHNTLVFIVDVRANKHQIRAAVKKLYNIEVQKVCIRKFALYGELFKWFQMDVLFDYVLEKYSWLIDSYMINYFVDDMWNKLPYSWRLVLENIEPDDCVCLVDATVHSHDRVLPLVLICLKALVKALPSREAVRSPDDIANACGIQNVLHKSFATITSRENLRIKLKPKKQHEIDRIVTTVDLLRTSNPGTACFLQNAAINSYVSGMGPYYLPLFALSIVLLLSAPSFDAVIDVGAGMGHLARMLSVSAPKCKIISIEQNGEVFVTHLSQISQDDEAKRLIDSVDTEWRRFLVVHCLRLLFAPIIEQIVITDRVRYLEEHGHSAAVVPLFDPEMSPRNLAIIARKI